MVEKIKRAWSIIAQWLSPIAGVGLLIAGVFFGLYGLLRLYPEGWLFEDVIRDFYANASTELISIGITVVIIDYLNKLRQDQQLKAQLIRDMGGRVNDFSLRAVRELRHYKWLYDGSLRRAVLWEANLEGADLEGANLEGANLWGANLWGARLEGANLVEAYLEGANLKGARLEGADLEGVNLKGANLEVANLEGANLRRANLKGANLKVANLEGANLEGADLEGANLWGASYSQKTVWPDDFNPEAAGASLKE